MLSENWRSWRGDGGDDGGAATAMTAPPETPAAGSPREDEGSYLATVEQLAGEYAAAIRAGRFDYDAGTGSWDVRLAADVRRNPYVRDETLRDVTLTLSPSRAFIFDGEVRLDFLGPDDERNEELTPENIAYIGLYHDVVARIEEVLGCDPDTYIRDRMEGRR